MTRRVSQSSVDSVGAAAQSMGTRGMVAVGEIPAKDREFEALLYRAAAFQKVDSGCKLRGEAG